MIAKYKGDTETGYATNYDFTFKENNEYNIETKTMNVEEFLREWEIKQLN